MRHFAPLFVSPRLNVLLTCAAQVKLIAEPWDIGMYQVGSFPNWDVWAEWNGKFRDDVRRFIRWVKQQDEGQESGCMWGWWWLCVCWGGRPFSSAPGFGWMGLAWA